MTDIFSVLDRKADFESRVYDRFQIELHRPWLFFMLWIGWYGSKEWGDEFDFG